MQFDLVVKGLNAQQLQSVMAALNGDAVPLAINTTVENTVGTRPPVHGMGPAPIVDTGPAPTAIFGSAPIPQSAPVEPEPATFADHLEVSLSQRAPAQSTAPIVSGEVDSAGMPWDARIHSSSRQKLAKGGGWKLRRGVDPAIVAAVEAELRGSVVAPAASQQAAPAPVVTPTQSYVQAQQAPVAAANTGAITFPSLVSKVASNISTGNIKKESVANILGKYGLKTTTDLVSRQDLWAAFSMDLDVAITDPMQ